MRDQLPLNDAWLDLGVYTFSTAQQARVRLGDLNNQPNLTETVSVSAMRFVYQAPSADTTPPTGQITSPTNQQIFGSNSTIVFSANASDNSGGSGVKQVQFWVRYAGGWHRAGTDTVSPYSMTWNRPSNLRSQIMELGIHVEDKAGNYCVDPNPSGNYTCNNASSKRTFSYYESVGNPNISENWIPKNLRIYLNQRSLENGDEKCGAASAAMILAMRGFIPTNYDSMKNTANDIFADVGGCLMASCYVNELNDRGANVEEKTYSWWSNGGAWPTIKKEIDAGRPIMLLTTKLTEQGHYIVVVGYREEGSSRHIIAYDPFGRWKNAQGQYDQNSTAMDSFKGQWVYYNIDNILPTLFDPKKMFLIIQKSTGLLDEGDVLGTTSAVSLTEPDAISNEPEDIVIYEGIPVLTIQIYLPLIVRQPN